MIPDNTRKEWENLIAGTSEYKISSLSLQLKLNALRLDYKLKKIDMRTAVVDLHNFCSQSEAMYQKDIMSIFSITNLTVK